MTGFARLNVLSCILNEKKGALILPSRWRLHIHLANSHPANSALLHHLLHLYVINKFKEGSFISDTNRFYPAAVKQYLLAP